MQKKLRILLVISIKTVPLHRLIKDGSVAQLDRATPF